jgi:hypothetical protein
MVNPPSEDAGPWYCPQQYRKLMKGKQLSAIRNMFEQLNNFLNDEHAEFVKRKEVRRGGRGAKDGRSEAPTVYCCSITANDLLLVASLLAPLIAGEDGEGEASKRNDGRQ